MQEILSTISENKEWIFSGVGVAVISLIIAIIRFILKRKKQNESNVKISTKGKNSPGYVKGNYTINENKKY